MRKILQISGLVLVLVIFFSITIKGKPLFTHVYTVISPITSYSQKLIGSLLKSSYTHTESYAKKLFNNSVPKVGDSVRSKMAAQKKATGEPLEEIPDQDKKELDQLIKTH